MVKRLIKALPHSRIKTSLRYWYGSGLFYLWLILFFKILFTLLYLWSIIIHLLYKNSFSDSWRDVVKFIHVWPLLPPPEGMFDYQVDARHFSGRLDLEHFTNWALIVNLAMYNRFHTDLVFFPSGPNRYADLSEGPRQHQRQMEWSLIGQYMVGRAVATVTKGLLSGDRCTLRGMNIKAWAGVKST